VDSNWRTAVSTDTGAGSSIPRRRLPPKWRLLPLIDFLGSGISPFSVGAASDPSLQKEFLVLWNAAGTSSYGLVRYDLNTYLPEAVLDLPTSVSTFNSTLTILRCGQDGLALITSSSIGANSQTPSVILMRGPFVAPQELETGTAASLTGSSATTITHGSGNTVLTLTGANFLPGVAVTWNGSYRTTTIVDATHITVAIPASDVVSAGSGLLVATNPGAPASNKLTITIN
jgi:trimeric autotransporter adhesin